MMMGAIQNGWDILSHKNNNISGIQQPVYNVKLGRRVGWGVCPFTTVNWGGGRGVAGRSGVCGGGVGGGDLQLPLCYVFTFQCQVPLGFVCVPFKANVGMSIPRVQFINHND
jgi:hypothetical protein